MVAHTSYLICTTHRTGSTLLCEALKTTGLAGRPEEYFWRDYERMWRQRWGTQTYRDYLAAALARTTTPNGVFGAKVMWAYLHDFVGKVRQLPEYDNLPISALLSTLFPNLHYIYITRRDKVRQAISLWRAVQTQVWAEFTDELVAPAQEPVFDFASIEHRRQNILRHETAWQRYFAGCGVTPFTVVYEDLITARESITLDILRYLGVSIPADLSFGPRRMRKQADALTEEWVRRYYQLKGQSA
jgi:LPS sulfotransferase NodH